MSTGPEQGTRTRWIKEVEITENLSKALSVYRKILESSPVGYGLYIMNVMSENPDKMYSEKDFGIRNRIFGGPTFKNLIKSNILENPEKGKYKISEIYAPLIKEFKKQGLLKLKSYR